MMIRVTIGLVLLVAIAGSALADEDTVKYFERARMLQAEGKTEAAIDAFRLVIREWPDDDVCTPQAHLMLVTALIHANRFDDAERHLNQVVKRYAGWEKLLAGAEKLEVLLRDRASRYEARKSADREAAVAIEALERRLKEAGLEGEELERTFEKEKKAIETARRFAQIREQYERVKKLWEAQGVSPEEIRERAERIEDERDRLVNQAKELERLARRLKEEGASAEAIERELEERRRRKSCGRGSRRRWNASRATAWPTSTSGPSGPGSGRPSSSS